MNIPDGWAARTALFALMLGLTAFPIRCGGSGDVRVYPVRGEVFCNGKPAAGALVHLHPRDKDARRQRCPAEMGRRLL